MEFHIIFDNLRIPHRFQRHTNTDFIFEQLLRAKPRVFLVLHKQVNQECWLQ